MKELFTGVYVIVGLLPSAALASQQILDLAFADVTYISETVSNFTAESVSSAGDFNGDGYDDVLIGAPRESGGGAAYLVYGGPIGMTSPGSYSLADADVVFHGDSGFLAWAGISVASVGDVNGDHIADIVIGAFNADPQGRTDAGESYLVYGRAGAGQYSGDVNLSSADVIFRGIDADDLSGISVTTAGDVNGDGLTDVLIGAFGADSTRGETYLIYGRDQANQLSGAINLSSANAVFRGIGSGDWSGHRVSTAGDINGDGFDDILINAFMRGETYLVYGGSGTDLLSGSYSLSAADAVFRGSRESMRSISTAGDLNGDGFDDVLLGAPGAQLTGQLAGAAYLFYGGTNGDQPMGINNLSTADAIFSGIINDSAGWSIATAGDVNNDGIEDILIGAQRANPSNQSNAGKAYLIFGRTGVEQFSGLFSLADADVAFEGVSPGDWTGYSVSSAGDVNGDGLPDLIIGARMSSPDNSDSPLGKAYIVYGSTIVTIPEPISLLLLSIASISMCSRQRCLTRFT